MTYGFEHNILESPYSLIISIILSLGVINCGSIVQIIINSKTNIFKSNFNIFFSPIIGVYFLLLVLYFVFIFEFYPIFFIKLISYSLFILGILQIIKIKIKIIEVKRILKKNRYLLLVISLLFLLLLISASPITHADSLDYHFLGALNLLNLGHFNKEIMPMHLNLVSIGELIISIGLALKAEQFSALIQTISLIALVPLFKGRNLFLIIILACPITFFLASSPKPQLILCISTFLIFVFLHYSSNSFSKKQLKFFFPIIIVILSLNSLAKFSFTLSSALLGIYFLHIMYKNRLFVYSFLTSLAIILIIFLPFWIFRYENFGTNFYEMMQSPLPINLYGYESLNNLLKGGTISILGLFFPKDLQSFSVTFGPLILLYPFISSKTIINYKKELLIIFIFISLVFLIGSNLSRFLFEGFLWATYLVSKNINVKSYFYKLFEKLSYLQILLIIPIYLYFILTIFPGSLIENSKNKIFSKSVYGYELAKWTNEILNKNDILLSTHRSISLFKNQTFSNIYTWHTEAKNNDTLIYYNFLKEKKVNKILFYGTKLDTGIYKNCLGKKLFYKKDVGSYVGRNPFTKKEIYSGWIFELDYNRFPDCLLG